MHESNDSTRLCLPHSLCNNFRSCPRCARIRQAKVASAVEKLQELCGPLTWHILYPHDASKLAAEQAKLQFLRKIKPEGAVWTVEESKKNNNLHINIITPRCQQAQIRAATTWAQDVTGNPRHLGAYISKIGQMPSQERYEGKLYGTAGNIWQILSQAHDAPIVQAAAAQFAIDSIAMLDRAAQLHIQQQQKQATFYTPEKKKTELSPEEKREIASRWLPDILEAQRKRSATKTDKPTNKIKD